MEEFVERLPMIRIFHLFIILCALHGGSASAAGSCEYSPWMGPAYGPIASKAYFRERGRIADKSDLNDDLFLANLAIFDHVRRGDFGFLDDGQAMSRLVSLNDPAINDALLMALVEGNDGEIPTQRMRATEWGAALLAWREEVVQTDNVRALFQLLLSPLPEDAQHTRSLIVKNYASDNPEVVYIASLDFRNHGMEEGAMNGWLVAASFAHAPSFREMARSPLLATPECRKRRQVFVELHTALIGE